MYATGSLPGVRIDVVPPPAVAGLPRMDVAVFAGFAASGPCHRAVAVDSVAAFSAVFGGEVTLAYDALAGAALRANLAAAVGGFFSNGGTLCWVIRLARTETLSARWRAVTGGTAPDPNIAAANRFAIGGVLARLPVIGGNGSANAPAQLVASSAGSWSDTLTLTARVDRRPVALSALQGVAFGLSFADPGGLVPGTLIELSDGAQLRYARVARIAGGVAFACWSGAFAAVTDGPPVAGTATADGTATAATLSPGAVTSIDRAATAGAWLGFDGGGERYWLQVDRVDGATSFGRAWREAPPALPAAAFAARRVSLDIMVRQPGRNAGDTIVTTGLSPTPETPNSVFALTGDDAFYADAANRTARSRAAFATDPLAADTLAVARANAGTANPAERFATPGFTAADAALLGAAWLPLGLDGRFDVAAAALPTGRPSLARDGLARFDDQLFLDPDLAGLAASSVVARAHQLRDLDARPLLGIHAALDTGDDGFDAPSVIAVPDAAHPGWTYDARPDPAPPPDPGAIVPPTWRDHAGGCAAGGRTALAAPDRSRFLDSTTRLIATPVLTAPAEPVTADSFALAWTGGAPGTVFVVEESARADFAAAVTIYRGPALGFTVAGRAEGSFYYRLRAELDGNISAFAAAVVSVRFSRYRSVPLDPERLRTLHTALLRLAAGSGDLFALLALPCGWRADAAIAHAGALRSFAAGFGSAPRLGDDERRVLSYGAIHHPWLVPAGGSRSVSPEGVVAGTIAARARRDGAWVAPANIALRDVVGLDPSMRDADLLPLDAARINAVRRLPQGFAVLDADTLSGEPEWRQIHVRRLMILLRRALLRTGLTYVFEPNSDITRRAVERSIALLLDTLQRRGAFAGATAAEAFRVALPLGSDDRDTGRLVVDIAVAPAQPLRFLTIRLVQQGARLTLTEEA